ncbi:hypothetical protein TUM4644_27790 [Shewanella colwelliana]|uniref:hypothetical protein n=1 Tax=Shewanella colwelliana TaxID=23 RepID=UPI001BC2F0CE|nr:hypothetical protein [Shewanella colwelliana]GIU29430.1 hypothetical protein TUM4644_27790 [Shewanella colwelliana]
MESNANISSLALQRLRVALTLWEQEKWSLGCKWLYLCARLQGGKLRSLWVSAAENTSKQVELELGDILNVATSFELEMLHSPETRILNPASENTWNSLRGIRAMLVEQGGETRLWAATEMIAHNLSFNKALNIHFKSMKKTSSMRPPTPVILYLTKQLFCDNRPSHQNSPTPSEMFRGNRVVETKTVDCRGVLRCVQSMTRWLASQVDGVGAAKYKYWPSRGSYASSNNAIRQWMATVCLNRVAKAFGSEQIAAIVARNHNFNLSTTFRREGELGYIWMNGCAKLGAAALAALAILESPHRKRFLNEEHALHSFTQLLSNPDGSFDTFYIPRERKDNQNFYSGEALLFLASCFRISRNSAELARIMAAFHYYRDWHRDNRNPAFVPWHTQAYFLVWQVTQDEALKAFIFEMNDWLLSMQQWRTAAFRDMQGRFHDPARPYFGPPHASSTGVYLEGLIDAFSLAKQCGDKQRAENYRIAIVRGIRSIMQLQFKDEVDCFYIKNVNRVLGGVRTTVYDNTIRIDNVQHALMALLKIYSRFEVRDYYIE